MPYLGRLDSNGNVYVVHDDAPINDEPFLVLSRQFAGKVMEAIDDGLDVVDDEAYERMSEVSEQLREMIAAVDRKRERLRDDPR